MPSITLASLNVRGCEGEAGLRRLLHRFRVQTRGKQKLAVMCIQEHMLPKNKHDELLRLIRIKEFDAEITYGKADDPTSAHGGTAIIWDTKAVTLKSTLDIIPGYIRVHLDWAGTTLEIANAYAPSSSAVARVDFFDKIEKRMTGWCWLRQGP